MGRRSILKSYQVYENADTATSPSTEATDVSGIDNVTYILAAANTVVCELAVYVTRDDDKNSTYVPLDFNEALAINGASDPDYTIKVQNHGFKWMRLQFVSTSGTGNINGWVSGNTVGA